jgi:hypothetical protein
VIVSARESIDIALASVFVLGIASCCSAGIELSSCWVIVLSFPGAMRGTVLLLKLCDPQLQVVDFLDITSSQVSVYLPL